VKSVWGSSANDVWAVGYQALMIHWDGTGWSLVHSPLTAANYGVWGSSSTDVWVVTDSGALMHWDGATWSVVASGTTEGLAAIWGSGVDDVWVVGGTTDAGIILHRGC
jgi:hypothetical protein